MKEGSTAPSSRLYGAVCERLPPSRFGPIMRLLLALAASALAQPSFANDPADGLASIRPLLQAHCYRCHSSSAAKLKASLRLDRLSAGLSDPASHETWRDVLKRVEAREMPP